MALTKEAKLEALRVGMKGSYLSVFTAIVKEWMGVANVIASSTTGNAYGWLDKFPQLRKWVNARVVSSMKEQGFTVPNLIYESTLGVKRTDLEDDNLGMYGTLAKNLAEEVIRFQNQNVFNILKKGDATLVYDGQNLFDKDHPVNGKTDGSGADSSVSNLFGVAGGDKVGWYLLDTSRIIKPVILQERTKPEFETIKNAQNDHVFMNDEYLYGIRYRAAFTTGFWQLSSKSYETLNADNFNAAYEAMLSFSAHGGQPLGVRPTKLVVPPSLRAKAMQLIKAERLDNGASNTNHNIVDVIVSPYL